MFFILYVLILLCIKQMCCIETYCLLCSEVSQEIDVLQEIYINELEIETNDRFYNCLLIMAIGVLPKLFVNT